MTTARPPEAPPRLRLTLRRDPLPEGLDRAALRARLRGELEQEVALMGRPRDQLLSVGPDWLEQARLPDDLAEERQAALWVALRGRAAVRSSFRRGELLLRDPATGRLRRAALLAELVGGSPDVPQWWATWRFFGPGQAGTGAWSGPWVEAEGEGRSALPPELAPWLDTPEERAQVEEELSEQLPAELALQGVIYSRPDGALPDDPTGLAEAIVQGFAPQWEDEGLDGAELFLWWPDRIDRVFVRGELPAGVDELVRNLAHRADGAAEAACLVFFDQVPDPELGERPVLVARAERPGQRVALVLLLDPARPGDLRPQLTLRQGPEPLPAGEGWLGVPPSVDLGLRLRGAEA